VKTVPNYPGGILCVVLFAITCGLLAYEDGSNPFLWGLAGGAITLVGVIVVWVSCRWVDR
jgi:membrane protein YdbS with pleckstrin-like domain